MYGIDPFSNNCPRHLTTDKIIEAEIVSDIIQAPELLVSQYKTFINDRPIKGAVSSPIKKNKYWNKDAVSTPIKKNKYWNKKMKRSHQADDILQEDCQFLGTIVTKALNLNEAFQYPIISVPLSIATLDGGLRQSEKASLGHFFIKTSNATTNCKLQN